MESVMNIQLGIIGESDGNGHPFSWGAICNGYNRSDMARCEYSNILEYLEVQKWPESIIENLAIVKIWTQEISRSKLIARATRIPEVCNELSDVSKNVDGVLLARDDAENHLHNATPSLNDGCFLYVDKPLALNVSTAQTILDLGRDRVFSCSALRFDNDLNLGDWFTHPEMALIKGVFPKNNERYAIHVLDPFIASIEKSFSLSDLQYELFDSFLDGINIVNQFHIKILTDSGKHLDFIFELKCTQNIHSPIGFQLANRFGEIIAESYHVNTFSTFKRSLEEFKLFIMSKSSGTSRISMLSSVGMLEQILS